MNQPALNEVVYNATIKGCPSRDLLVLLGSKWTLLTLCVLAGGSKRYSQINKSLNGVSQKMLTQSLKELESAGILSRQVTPTVPIRVDYELTELGHSLMEVIQPLRAWAEINMHQVAKHRHTFARIDDC